MKSIKKLSGLTAFFIFCAGLSLNAQSTKADIFNEATEITWLGMDFSEVKIIGSATQFGDAGEINNDQIRTKYFPAWNQLFINELKKYDVAGAIQRKEVKYAIDITEKVNSAAKNDFLSNSPDDYSLLTEEKITGLIKKYDFQGKTGIGMMFFIDGISKGKVEASGWVTFVDMKTKKVLLTVHETGKAGGIGFKNYWAKAFYNILKAVKSDYKSWKK